MKEVVVEGMQGRKYKTFLVRKKPTRKELLQVVSALQTLVGNAKFSAQDDRNPNQMDHTIKPLEIAFELCVDAVGYDDPV